MALGARIGELEVGEVAEGFPVTLGDAAAPLHPHGQVGQLDVEDCRLQGIKAAVVTQVGMEITARHAMHRQLPDALGQAAVAADHGPAITGGPQVLGGEKAEAAGIPPASHRAPGPASAAGLGAIFDHPQAMAQGDGVDALHVHRPAKEMDRQQGAGGGGDGRLDAIEIEQIAGWIHVHEHRRGPHGADGLGGGEKAERGGDHLVSRADLQGPQGQGEGIGAAVAADGVGDGAGRSEAGLEGVDHAPADVLATAQHLQNSLIKAVAELPQLLFEAEGGNGHGGNLKSNR